MQKILERNTYIPTGVQSLLARSSMDLSLNRLEKVSEQVLKTPEINPQGAQSQHTERSLKPLVYVISKENKPLMPCSCAKAKRMLKKEAATVVKRIPFTIQLNFECENVNYPPLKGRACQVIDNAKVD